MNHDARQRRKFNLHKADEARIRGCIKQIENYISMKESGIDKSIDSVVAAMFTVGDHRRWGDPHIADFQNRMEALHRNIHALDIIGSTWKTNGYDDFRQHAATLKKMLTSRWGHRYSIDSTFKPDLRFFMRENVPGRKVLVADDPSPGINGTTFFAVTDEWPVIAFKLYMEAHYGS